MGPTVKDLGVDKPSPDQRIALAREIRDSLPRGRLLVVR